MNVVLSEYYFVVLCSTEWCWMYVVRGVVSEVGEVQYLVVSFFDIDISLLDRQSVVSLLAGLDCLVLQFCKIRGQMDQNKHASKHFAFNF